MHRALDIFSVLCKMIKCVCSSYEYREFVDVAEGRKGREELLQPVQPVDCLL